MKKVILIVLFLFVSSVGFADDDKTDERKIDQLIKNIKEYIGFADDDKTDERLRVGVNVFGGAGMQEYPTGLTTTSGEDVMFSTGGGIGGAITWGSILTSKWDLDITVGRQRSGLSVDLSNADLVFERNFFLTTIKYKIPVSKNMQVKIGAGLGCYISGRIDLDFSQTGGYHDIIKYDPAVGFHFTSEYELFFSNRSWSASIGAKYYNVSYKAVSLSSDDNTEDPAILDYKYIEPDGSGFDLIIALSKYF